MFDVIIIGAGIVGCAAARELSKCKLNILVLEKEDDIGCGATKANSGIVHAGYDCEPGTLKARLNVRGVELYSTLVKELDIPYRNNGSLVLCFDENDIDRLTELYDKGVKNGVTGLRIISREEVLELEPNLSTGVKAALLSETAGVISPYEAAIAFAENAYENGARFLFDTKVLNVEAHADGFTVETESGSYKTRTVVNAAGIYADEINNRVSEEKTEIHPQRGQYYLLDNTHADFIHRTIFQLPTEMGKGVLLIPTVDHNILVGPNAENIDERDATPTTPGGLSETLRRAGLSSEKIPIRDKITAFAGIRAKTEGQDFIINEPVSGFVNALGIDSPGLSAAPAIGEEIAKLIAARLQPEVNEKFNGRREGIKRFKDMTFAEKEKLFKKNSSYGNVICRCETVTEAEIVDAIHRPLGARSLDGVKRRTRAQMGRCQGGFCTIRIIEILSRELSIKETDVTKKGGDTQILFEKSLEVRA